MKKILMITLVIGVFSSLGLFAQQTLIVSTGGTGWKRIASVQGSGGRSFGRITLFTQGGNYAPYMTSINWHHDWVSNAGISIYSDSDEPPYWSGFRITDDGTNSYIEVNFTTSVTELTLMLDDYGWRAATLYSGVLPNGGGNIRATTNNGRMNIQNEFSVKHNGFIGIGTLTPVEKLDVRGNILWDGFNSGNPRAVKIGYSGGNYGGIGYNMDFTSTTGIFNRPLNDHSSYLEFWNGGFRFFGSSNSSSAQNVNLNGSGNNLNILATLARSGNFGIGTNSPVAKLSVSNNGAEGIEMIPGSSSNLSRIYAYNRSTNLYNGLIFNTTDIDFRNNLDVSRLFIQNSSGNVGIGTTTPNSKLAVNGKICAQEVNVKPGPWPDYVFAKSYLFPTLQETEKYIKEKGHLPGIPSAAEVKVNGIDLGEMNAKLLQKIEELTLYLIEIQKKSEARDDKQTKEIEYLKSKLK